LRCRRCGIPWDPRADSPGGCGKLFEGGAFAGRVDPTGPPPGDRMHGPRRTMSHNLHYANHRCRCNPLQFNSLQPKTPFLIGYSGRSATDPLHIGGEIATESPLLRDWAIVAAWSSARVSAIAGKSVGVGWLAIGDDIPHPKTAQPKRATTSHRDIKAP